MIGALLKYKKVIIISVIALVLLVMVWSFFKKDKIELAPVPEDDINDLPSESEIEKANELARAMYSNFENYNSLSFWYRPMKPFEEFLKVSDRVFVMAYNRFNALYGSAGKGSLREWMHDEAFSDNDWKFIETLLFPRMDRLNLA